ncbi:MAG: hemolysin III family protein [Geobacteraceae bacterium]|nr:hemolysin III family protein [Geobacteraceae bacterium]
MNNGQRFNIYTSLPGMVAAPVAATLLLVAAARQGDPWKIVSFAIYGATLVLLWTSNTLYHALRGKAEPVLRKLDHCSIYLLIAGTYTPFCLVTLRGGWGWTLLALVWGLAVVGVVVELWWVEQRRIIPLLLYLTMGWTILLAIRPLLRVYPWQGMVLLAAGGLFYTGGIVFYALDKRFARAHGLWHLCVLAGSISHYLAVLLYIA